MADFDFKIFKTVAQLWQHGVATWRGNMASPWLRRSLLFSSSLLFTALFRTWRAFCTNSSWQSSSCTFCVISLYPMARHYVALEGTLHDNLNNSKNSTDSNNFMFPSSVNTFVAKAEHLVGNTPESIPYVLRGAKKIGSHVSSDNNWQDISQTVCRIGSLGNAPRCSFGKASSLCCVTVVEV